jgi:hypothetical protein
VVREQLASWWVLGWTWRLGWLSVWIVPSSLPLPRIRVDREHRLPRWAGISLGSGYGDPILQIDLERD